MRLALALLFVSGVAAAQPAGSGKIIQVPLDDAAPEVQAAASPSDVKLGAQFTVFVTAVFGPGVTVNLREPIELGGSFEVRKHVSSDSVRADGRRQREWQLEVYAWDLGDLEVPPIAVTFVAAGHAGQVATNAVPIRVTGVLGDSDDPKLMRPYAPAVALFEHTWLWNLLHDPLALGIAAAVLVAAFLIARWPRKRRAVVPVRATFTPAPRKKLDMTAERALQRLREIADSGTLVRDTSRKLGYADMADVIREYVGVRFAIAAARELTSGELIAELARISPGDRERIAAWLERCDPVKYGGVAETAAGANELLADARALVLALAKGAA
ncbi:MAG TPA: hypothetical protein VGL61_08450 [Kofleriaceae bacterium]|jgi:hypothetical protein